MKKKITSIVLFVLITLIATTIYAAITANANLVTSSSKVKPGEEFTVKLSIKDINAGDEGIMGVQAKINYDKDLLETLVEDNMKGVNGAKAYYNESNKGNILIAPAASAVKSDADFVEITFKVKENAEIKDATITLQDIEIFNSAEKVNLGNKTATVKVTNESGSDEEQDATPTPTPTSEPTEKPNGGSESTPTPSTKPGETNNTPTPTATAKPNSGENKNDVPVTNIDTNTSSGSSSSNKGNTSSGSSSSSGSSIKGPTTSSNSLPKAGIGSTIAVLTVVVAIIGTVSYIKLRKYNEI